MMVVRPLSMLLRGGAPAVRQFSTSAIRPGGGAWSYRTGANPAPQWTIHLSQALMTVTWWWIFHGRLWSSIGGFVLQRKMFSCLGLH